MPHAKTVHPAKLGSRKRVLILALPPVDALDVIGPAEVFALANSLCREHPEPYSVELVSSAGEAQIPSHTGIALVAHHTLQEEQTSGRAIDTLIVTSGWNPAEQLDENAIEWIREQSPKVRRLCSICVGAFALAHAGLLNGRRATTHWRMARDMADRYPLVNVDPNPIWIKDGNLYTSAGISAGIDLALALVGEDLGEDIALEVAKNLVLFLRRPGGQAQFSIALQSQHHPGSNLDELCVWISEHLHSELTVEILADHLSISVRTLIRLFQRDLKTTPAKYIEDVRIEAVCRALELGGRSLEDIARICGYRSIDVLRKAFIRRMGVSPRDYGVRFARDGGGQ
ncbi:GlxA family transcriptional regulator [Pseudomonas sp. NPDC090203]|uniref:GlxA family transcriptional regulator n=1 Tax=Pseudomonas sp. NPDC090203 TaxID=3364477 RepID=UPI0038126C35